MQFTLELPDNLELDSGFDESDWLREIAIALFQKELVSLGRASKIAGMQVSPFQQFIAKRGICVHYDVEEFEQDLQMLQGRGWL